MKLEIEASWKELLCITGAVVLCVAAFVAGTYLGVDSMNGAAADIQIEKNADLTKAYNNATK